MNAAEIHRPRDLYITDELHSRVTSATDHREEKLALHDIAAQMLAHPEQVLPVLVERAMQMTGAASAGISAFEPEEGGAGHFRWRDLRGKLASFEGATTPRNYSPCGVCLDRFEPTLSRRPERHYSWIEEAGVVCPEVLLVPLCMTHDQPLGTLWVVSDDEGRFDREHARVLKELASFAGIALAVLQNQQRLQEALAQQEMLAREIEHRLDSVFSLTEAMIHVAEDSATSAADFALTLSVRLRALATAHTLIRECTGVRPASKPRSPVTFRGLA